MRQRQLYDQLACFVCPDALTNAECVALECCLRDGGAKIVTDLSASSSTTHIICHPLQYERFLTQRNERFIAIVRPEWVFKTFLLQTLVSVDRFSANPALIFSSLVIAAGPIDKDPRKVIDGLIAHFGGQIVENESDSIGATHILSLDEPSQSEEPAQHQWFHLSYTENDVLRNVQTWRKWLLDRPISLEFALPSCVVAYLGKVTGLAEQHHVNYSWIEDCVRRKTRVPEGAFSVKSPDLAAKKAPNWKTRPEIQIEDIGLAKCVRVYHSSKADANGVELTLARRSSAEVRISQCAFSLCGLSHSSHVVFVHFLLWLTKTENRGSAGDARWGDRALGTAHPAHSQGAHLGRAEARQGEGRERAAGGLVPGDREESGRERVLRGLQVPGGL